MAIDVRYLRIKNTFLHANRDSIELKDEVRPKVQSLSITKAKLPDAWI